MTLPAFRYAPLDPASDGIRLLRLVQGEPADPIECQILEACLGDTGRTPYEALSYCWGSNETTSAVILDGCHKPVTDNLSTALKHLRSRDTDRILWIDALCIDQDNKKEQGHQVAQMRKIYENAKRVVVWLGEGTEETDMLMGVMGLLEDHPLGMDSPTRGRTPGKVLRSIYRRFLGDSSAAVENYDEICGNLARTLSQLLGRPWFRRIWVIQEVACARSVVFMCGGHHISTRTFFDLAYLLGVLAKNQARAILDVLPGWRAKGSWWNQNRDLRTLLAKFQNCEATDERDKVYALLGISSDASLGNVFPPNYEKPMQEVVQNTISFLLFGELVDLATHPLPCWTLDQVIHGGTNLDERTPFPLPCSVFRWALMNAAISTAVLLLKPSTRGAPISSPAEYYRHLASASSSEEGQLVAALLAYEHAPRNPFDSLMVRLGGSDAAPSFQLLCSNSRESANDKCPTEVLCFPIFEGQSALVIAQAQQKMRQSEGWHEPSQQKLNSFLSGFRGGNPPNSSTDLFLSLVRQGADPRNIVDELGGSGHGPFMFDWAWLRVLTDIYALGD